MKSFLGYAVAVVVGFAGGAEAQVSVALAQTELSVPELMEKCSNAEGGSEAQLKCFDLLAKVLKEQEAQQAAAQPDSDTEIVDALNALRAMAEYQDSESGLTISGNGCVVQTLYYGNYYRISRRNVSSIDLFSAQFNASKLRYEETTQLQGQSLAWFRGMMEPGATAVSKGGAELDSSANNFAAKSAGATLDQYAVEVLGQLPAQEEQTFDFVLIHPAKYGETQNIWRAFERFVLACRS